jgi:hypothetical protein
MSDNRDKGIIAMIDDLMFKINPCAKDVEIDCGYGRLVIEIVGPADDIETLMKRMQNIPDE